MSALAHAGAVDNGLAHYLGEIRRYPTLTRDEEFDLAKRWRDDGDREAAHKLVTSHLRLVVKMANRYRGYGLPLGELIGEGNVGMVRAIKGFDPDRGFRLATYAMWWIRAALNEYVVNSRSVVKMGTTAAQRKLFFNLARLKKQLGASGEQERPPRTVSEIARGLQVPEGDVVMMNRRLAARDNSLNAPLGGGGAGEWQDQLVDDSADQETRFAQSEELALRRALLKSSWELLNEREKSVLSERWLTDQPTTLDKLSRRFGVSRERVRQIETRAIEKLRKSTRRELMQGPGRPREGQAQPTRRRPDLALVE